MVSVVLETDVIFARHQRRVSDFVAFFHFGTVHGNLAGTVYGDGQRPGARVARVHDEICLLSCTNKTVSKTVRFFFLFRYCRNDYDDKYPFWRRPNRCRWPAPRPGRRLLCPPSTGTAILECAPRWTWRVCCARRCRGAWNGRNTCPNPWAEWNSRLPFRTERPPAQQKKNKPVTICIILSGFFFVSGRISALPSRLVDRRRRFCVRRTAPGSWLAPRTSGIARLRICARRPSRAPWRVCTASPVCADR